MPPLVEMHLSFLIARPAMTPMPSTVRSTMPCKSHSERLQNDDKFHFLG